MAFQQDILNRMTRVNWPSGRNVLEITAMYWPEPNTQDVKIEIEIEGQGSFNFPSFLSVDSVVPEGIVPAEFWKEHSIWNYPLKGQPLNYYNDGVLFIKQFKTNTWIVNLNRVVAQIVAALPEGHKDVPEKLIFSVHVYGVLGRVDTVSEGSYGFGGWHFYSPNGTGPETLVLAVGSSLGNLAAALAAGFPGSFPTGGPAAALAGSSPWPDQVAWIVNTSTGDSGTEVEGSAVHELISGSWTFHPPSTITHYDYFTFMFSAKSFLKAKSVDVFSTDYDPLTDYDMGSHYDVKSIGKNNVRDPDLEVGYVDGRFDYGEFEADGGGLSFDKKFRFSLDLKNMLITDLT